LCAGKSCRRYIRYDPRLRATEANLAAIRFRKELDDSARRQTTSFNGVLGPFQSAAGYIHCNRGAMTFE
jgi:hypothetical protein